MKDPVKKAYICASIVVAWPKDNSDAKGYTVQYPSGHTNWCPKEIFENHYRKVDSNEYDMIQDYVEGNIYK